MVAISPPSQTGGGTTSSRPALVPVAQTAIVDGPGMSDGTATMVTFETKLKLSGSVTDLAFAHDGFRHDSFWPVLPNDFFIKHAVKVTTATGDHFIPVTWPDGRTFLHVQPGSMPVVSVPLPTEFRTSAPALPLAPTSPTITLRTVVWVDEAGKKWPTHKHGIAGDRMELGADKLTAATVGTADGGELTMPALVLGRHVGAPQPAVALHGDSIGLALPGVFHLVAPLLPITNLSVQSERGATVWSDPQTHISRLALGAFSKNAIFEYNTNEGIQIDGDQSNQMKLNAILFARQRQQFGIVTWPTTLLPATTSTDGWTTVANQAKRIDNAYATYQPARVTYNDWLRDGGPVDPDTFAAVAAGAAGLRSGEEGHPFGYVGAPAWPGADRPGYIEHADPVETARNSGIWKAPGGTVFTGDGVHPGIGSDAARSAAFSVTPLLD